MTSPRKLFLCVDCGGTKTAAVIVDGNSNVVGRGSGGPSNFTDVGMTAFLRAVKVAVEAALAVVNGAKVQLPTSTPLLSAAWFGISGCDRPADAIALQQPLSSLLSIPVPNLTIANDTHLLASPLSSHPSAKSAVVVIAGTGSNCMSFKRKEGASAGLVELGRSGGWGWILGDEGSGFFVGRTAVRYLLTQWDRASVDAFPEGTSCPICFPVRRILISITDTQDIQSEISPVTNKPTLRARIFTHFGITAPPDLFSVVYTADPPPVRPSEGVSANVPLASPNPDASTTPTIDVAPAPTNGNPNIYLLERKHRLTSLAPLVFSSAFDDNDPDALKVLRTSARSLADHIHSLMISPNPGLGRISPKAVRPEETVLCFGGSLVGIKQYRALIVDELGRIRQGLGVGEGVAQEMKDEGRGVVAGVEFVGDAAVSGAIGLANGYSG